MEFVFDGPIGKKKIVLVKIMAWCRIGDKSLSEPILIQVTDAYVQH